MANKAGLKNSQTVYSATYSNVPVYEFNLPPNHVMRRRSDDWINATHILKVADYDKPARTRILEREVQKGVHEKVQGGYGKYQGTWIPLPDGRELAAKNGVLEKLRPIFDFVPGDRSPPPAPKHETAASSKPRVPRQAAAQARKAATAAAVQLPYQHAQDYEQLDVRAQEGAETPAEDAQTVASESQFDEYEHQAPPSRKRKRRPGTSPPSPPPPRTSQADREHYMWADEVLDYFMLQDPSLDSPALAYPTPPSNASLNRPIDEKGHTALHWAAAMGDIEVVKDLIRRGASVDSQSATGETPLMRAVTFTNCFDKQNMERLAALLVRTINMQDWTSGSTAFHHVAGITQSKKKYECARYYLDCLLAKVVELLSPNDVERVLNEQDRSGDTAITIAARHGARKCVRSLIGRNAAVGIVNHVGETADQLIVQLNFRRQERRRGMAGSSSPLQSGMAGGGAVRAVSAGRGGVGMGVHGSLNGGHGQDGGGFTGFGLGGGEDGWKSEAALTLTSSIFPSMAAKSQLLARTFDAEVREKDAELAEAERVVSVRQAELEGMRRQAEELRVREAEQMGELVGSDFGEEDEERVLGELVVECEGLVQEEAGEVLREMIAAEEAKIGRLTGSQLNSDGDPDPNRDGELTAHFQLARALLALHGQRQGLLSRIVANLAMAGYRSNDAEARERRGMYKKLIEGALMVRGEEVEGLLPEMLRDLEEGGVGGLN
ncbi:Transcription factor mbp1 [Friedmanniomyces endolithicus]|uniref:Transcription factor mbp1 n=1 Tax=Friedmanniomyces endolithicus TaxID=329885 RepID=A0AAN6G5K6_9PEZI|nr:Transcription factor mbp1 [Friedmanniomyces endolithicus]KAK0298651.1 Transcription factor mbp1 [Friedmanniomyces endolithicus]KAK0328156.1 Transcription factor mbp1 [Friedmanniomyces endolithicus]KAK1001606.1 Transcription factor mbp1 [Friedmanniomyces endolithicus]